MWIINVLYTTKVNTVQRNSTITSNMITSSTSHTLHLRGSCRHILLIINNKSFYQLGELSYLLFKTRLMLLQNIISFCIPHLSRFHVLLSSWNNLLPRFIYQFPLLYITTYILFHLRIQSIEEMSSKFKESILWCGNLLIN